MTDALHQDVLDLVRTRLNRGDDLDAVLAQMRAKGMTEIPCIKALRDTLVISLGSAKALVHLSPAFADRRERNDVFHESLVGALNDINEINHRIGEHETEAGDAARQLGDLRAALAIALKMIKSERGPDGLTLLNVPTDTEIINEIYRLRDLAEARAVQQESTATTR